MPSIDLAPVDCRSRTCSPAWPGIVGPTARVGVSVRLPLRAVEGVWNSSSPVSFLRAAIEGLGGHESPTTACFTRSSSREVGIRVPTFFRTSILVIRGALPTKKGVRKGT